MELTPWSNLGFASPNAWLIGVVMLVALAFWSILAAAVARQGTALEKAKAGTRQALTAIAGLSIGFGLPYAAHLVTFAT